MRVEEYLSGSARRSPDRIAIVQGGHRLSYAQFDAASRDFAAGLASRAGFARDERCVVFLENRIETAVAIFGTLHAGGIFSVINPTTKADKLAFVLDDCGAAVLVTQASLLHVALAAVEKAPTIRRVVVTDRVDDSGNPLLLGYDELL